MNTTKIIPSSKAAFTAVSFLPMNKERKGEGGLRTQGYSKKSHEGNPLISIITVVYNGEKYLEETIQSIINQTYSNIEYIIIDGDSTDGTLEIIRKYEDKIDYWISERDEGISDAFNKGKNLCQGKYHIFINSDDVLADVNVLSSLKSLFLQDVDLICGRCLLEYSSTTKLIVAKKYGYKMPTAHQSMFFNTKTMLGHDYVVRNKFTMDYELFLIYLKNKNIFYSDVVVARMKMIGLSQQNICKTTWSYISLNYSHNDLISIFRSVLSMLKGCLKSMLRKL